MYGWGWGFFSAAIGMFIGIIWFYFQSHHIGSAGLPPRRVYDTTKRWQLNLRDKIEIIAIIIATAFLVLGLLKFWANISEAIKTNLIWILGIVGGTALVVLITKNTKGKAEWSKVFVIIVLCIFSIFFFAGFEQAGGTLNLFAEHNTNRATILGTIPASLFQAINPVFIIVFSFIFTILWTWLAHRKKEPNIPVKFGLGMLFLGLGFWLMSIANSHASGTNLVSPLWLVMVYLLHTFGELCLSPIGLSMISRLAPTRIVSVMMGLWFACSALAQYLAGALESILHNYLPKMELFTFITMTSMITAAVILLMSPFLNKMMK
jgi:POT family proton-dependent oligopeptide transporter